MTVTIWIAFFAGIASFLSPCVISLVPIYISYLTGRTVKREKDVNKIGMAVLHGFFFTLGFSFVFISLGLTVSALGSLLYEIKEILAKIGGIIVILFGVHISGIYRLHFLEYDFRPQNKLDQSRGLFSSFMLGVFFSAGWSPCIGPVLGSILALAINLNSIEIGTWLLVAYSIGMAIPFLIAAAGIGWVSGILRKYAKVLNWIEVITGIILIILGILLFAGIFSTLAAFSTPITL